MNERKNERMSEWMKGRQVGTQTDRWKHSVRQTGTLAYWQIDRYRERVRVGDRHMSRDIYKPNQRQ